MAKNPPSFLSCVIDVSPRLILYKRLLMRAIILHQTPILPISTQLHHLLKQQLLLSVVARIHLSRDIILAPFFLSNIVLLRVEFGVA